MIRSTSFSAEFPLLPVASLSASLSCSVLLDIYPPSPWHLFQRLPRAASFSTSIPLLPRISFSVSLVQRPSRRLNLYSRHSSCHATTTDPKYIAHFKPHRQPPSAARRKETSPNFTLRHRRLVIHGSESARCSDLNNKIHISDHHSHAFCVSSGSLTIAKDFEQKEFSLSVARCPASPTSFGSIFSH